MAEFDDEEDMDDRLDPDIEDPEDDELDDDGDVPELTQDQLKLLYMISRCCVQLAKRSDQPLLADIRIVPPTLTKRKSGSVKYPFSA